MVLSALRRTLCRMTSDPQTIAWLDQEDAHLAQTIRVHRWAVQYVGEGEEPDEPAFGYTIGLYGLGHPELVVVGSAGTAHTASSAGSPAWWPRAVTCWWASC
jgi:hypothetical protein